MSTLPPNSLNHEHVDGLCVVCAGQLPEAHQAPCDACSAPFHMRMTENADAQDCGVVYLDEESCAVLFLCSPCYQTHVLAPQQAG